MGLFSGKTENRTEPETASPPRESRRTPVASASTSSAPTVIGQQAVIKGELSSEDNILVEGRVEGKIAGGSRVIIGRTGRVDAEVLAEIVSVQGEVHGDCEGRSKVEITATGRVFGNITADKIVVAEGATFRGASRMASARKPVAVERAPAPTQSTPHDDRRDGRVRDRLPVAARASRPVSRRLRHSAMTALAQSIANRRSVRTVSVAGVA